MRKNYFAKLVNYIKNVYHIERGLNKLNDGRLNPTYKTAQVIMPVLLSFLLRVRSFNAIIPQGTFSCFAIHLVLMIKENEFKNVFPKGAKLPKVDAIRDTLKTIDISGLRDILKYNVKKSIYNKVFENGTIDGYTVAAIDGTKFFGSNKKSCQECLKNKNHCFHSGSVMAIVGVGPKLVIDFELYKPGIDLISKEEGELSVSKRLLTNAVREHKNLIDLVVYDALAFNSVWFNLCNSLETHAVV